MAPVLAFAVFVAGLLLVAVGAALVYLPAGLIVGGASTAAVAALALHELSGGAGSA